MGEVDDQREPSAPDFVDLLGRLGDQALSLTPQISGYGQEYVPQLFQAAIEQMIDLARDRVRRIALAQQAPRTQRLPVLAAAVVRPLVMRLGGAQAQPLRQALRLYYAQQITIPRAEWWTPPFIAAVQDLAPDLAPKRIFWVANIIHQALNSYAVQPSMGSLLPLDPVAQAEADEFLCSLVGGILSGEIEFRGRLGT